jgi:hypothetical protein
MLNPYQHPIQHSLGSSLMRANFGAGLSDEQWRKAEADLLHNYYSKIQQQYSAGQSNHQIIDTSHEIYHQGDQQFVPEIPIRIHQNNNPSPNSNPNQSSHRTLLPIPQFGEYSDPSPNPGQSTSHQTFPPIPQFEENSYLNEIQGQQSGFHIHPSMGYHVMQSGNSIDVYVAADLVF